MANTHIISLLVDNNKGVLSAILETFSKMGINIDTLTTSKTAQQDIARITIVFYAEKNIVEDIVDSLSQYNVIKTIKLFNEDEVSSAELLLIKISVSPAQRAGVFKMVQTYKAIVLDVGQNTMTVEYTGSASEIDEFTLHIQKNTVIEYARTGLTALEKGDNAL